MAPYNNGLTDASWATDGNPNNEDEVVQRVRMPTSAVHTTQQAPPYPISASMSHNAANGTAAYSGTGDDFPGATLPEYASGPAAAAYDHPRGYSHAYNSHISQDGPYYMPPQNQQQSAGAQRPTYPLSQVMDDTLPHESAHQYDTYQPTPATSLTLPTAPYAPTQTFVYQPINPGMNTQTQLPHTAMAPVFPRQAPTAPKKKKKSYKSRVGTPRTRCNCPYAFCDCKETFYERTRDDNLQCAECLKAHPARRIHTSSSATSHQSSQAGGQAVFAQQPQAPAGYGDIYAQQAAQGAEYAAPSIGRNDYSSISSTSAMLPAYEAHTAQTDGVPAAIMTQSQAPATYDYTAGPDGFTDTLYLQDDSISSPSGNEAAHPDPLSFNGTDLDFDPLLLDEMIASTSPADGDAASTGESIVSAEQSHSANDGNENNGVEGDGVPAESTEATESPEFLDEFHNEADATARLEHRDGKVKLLKLNVEGTDDFDTVTDEVERELKKSLFDAILHCDKSFTPEAVGLDKQAAYHITQEDAHTQCKHLMRTSEDVGQASAACAKVYYTAKRLHETGVPCTLLQENGKRTKTNYYVDHSTTFVSRIKTIIVVAENKRISVDLRHADREFTGLYDLILCPDAYLRRKLQNFAGNKAKNDILAQETARKEEEAKAAKADGKKVGKKVGRKDWMTDGRKRVVDGEAEVEAASGMGTEDLHIASPDQEALQPSKSKGKRQRTVWDEVGESESTAMAPGTGRKRAKRVQK
ncbi:hypothetical protein LTR27_012882 [Elasticomyces elasticus]|nr:hypothetical protein LTR27_012882 [Elasticomyces elasticus]